MTPAELTIAFIEDYKKWNDFAYKLGKEKTSENNLKISSAYHDLIRKFCSVSKEVQPLAYGSESNHCPDQESIVTESIVGNTASIITKFQNRNFDFLSHVYEYEFCIENGKWILDELYLVDKTGKFKCL
ncbi:MAG: hypothetical protein CMO01_10225 [Thalassobius sp.]|nr:hypothetical protein [Thalassovita sp.]